MTPEHLHLAYTLYLQQRQREGVGQCEGEEESFCLKCKDGGDVLLCDFAGCIKSHHARCCNLKTAPEGIWECPRHRCITCGSGPSRTDAAGQERSPDVPNAVDIHACRTCPTTYCTRCLPEQSLLERNEMVC